MPILRALCLLIFALGAPAGAAAQVEVGARVPGSADLTYADLLKQVVPDLALADGEATGTQVQPLRHIAQGFGGDPPANVAIRTVHTLALEAEGRRRLLVLAHLGASEDRVEETVVLALFDQEPSPKLLDAVDVGMDRFTSLGQPPLLRIGPKDEAIVTTSSHHNSHQSYRTTALLAVQGGRFKLIDTFSTLGDRVCKGRDELRNSQTLSFAAEPSKGERYHAIRATVIEGETVKAGACGGKEGRARASSRRWSASYRWSEAGQAFVRSSDALKNLEARNEKRF
jgi:hypothetical protein